jgi:hypothetical protein
MTLESARLLHLEGIARSRFEAGTGHKRSGRSRRSGRSACA